MTVDTMLHDANGDHYNAHNCCDYAVVNMPFFARFYTATVLCFCSAKTIAVFFTRIG